MLCYFLCANRKDACAVIHLSLNIYSEKLKRLLKVQDEYGPVKELARREVRSKQLQQAGRVAMSMLCMLKIFLWSLCPHCSHMYIFENVFPALYNSL